MQLENKQKNWTKGLFVVYLIVLIWIIVFKFTFSVNDISTLRNINLVPLEGTAVYDNQLDYSEIINNVVIFIPFGLYLSMLKPKWSFLKKLVPIIGTSLIFETIQYALAIGATDITDLIGNTLGGLLGIILFFVMFKLLNHRCFNVLNTIGTIGTITFFAFIGSVIL